MSFGLMGTLRAGEGAGHGAPSPARSVGEGWGEGSMQPMGGASIDSFKGKWLLVGWKNLVAL